MKRWISVSLPEDFITLLRGHFKSSKEIKDALSYQCRVSPGFASLVQNTFSDIDALGNIDRILSSIGWRKLRDSLAAMYLSYQREGYFPSEVNQALFEKLNYLEDEFENISFSGSSRVFLLGFYLLMCEEAIRKNYHLEDEENDNFFLYIPDNVRDFIKRKKESFEKPDLLLFNLCHFYEYGVLKADLMKDLNFSDFFDGLSEDQKTNYLGNLSRYCYSINDTTLFQKEV